jgi:hypothetical protein
LRRVAGRRASRSCRHLGYLLFLKLADEMTELGFDNRIPKEFAWSKLSSKVAAASRRSSGSKKQRRDASATFIFRKAQNKISNPSDLQRLIKMIGDEDWSGMDCCQLGITLQGTGRKGLNGRKPAGSELFGREQGRGIGADVLQRLPYLLELEDSFEKLEFVDERALGAEPGESVLKRIAEMFRQKLAEHRDMLLVLAPCLVEAEQAVAFALEEGQGIDDRDSADDNGALQNFRDFVLWDSIDIAHQVDPERVLAFERKDADLAIRRGSSFDERPSPSVGFNVAKRGKTHPKVAVLRSKGSVSLDSLSCALVAEVFRPKVDRLTAFKKVWSVRCSKIPEKVEIIGDSGFHRRQRPSDCLRLEIRAFLKNPSGKMEFSRCRTAGSSPALRRSTSARREARFSASRDSRLNFSDGFMAAGLLTPSL